MKKTIIIMVTLLALCLIAGGTTIAWLGAQDSISNTFSVGKISISLDEPTWSQNTNKIYPGAVIPKDPTVTIQANSEDCYVYIMIDNKLNETIAGSAMLNIQDDWTLISTSGSKTVYRYAGTTSGIVSLSSSNQTLTPLFTTVSISTTIVTEGNIQSLNNKTILVKAYAHQANATTQTMADDAAIAYLINS